MDLFIYENLNDVYYKIIFNHAEMQRQVLNIAGVHNSRTKLVSFMFSNVFI